MSDEHDGTSWLERTSARAARKRGIPKGWHGWIYEVAPQGGMFVTGAVCPPITRGPRKGKPNYRKHDKSTKCIVYLNRSETK